MDTSVCPFGKGGLVGWPVTESRSEVCEIFGQEILLEGNGVAVVSEGEGDGIDKLPSHLPTLELS